MRYNNAILNARRIATYYEMDSKGLRRLAIDGTLALTPLTNHEDYLALVNKQGEIDLDDALRVAEEHGAEVSIVFTFKTPIDVSDSD